jgi:hypothetical protein
MALSVVDLYKNILPRTNCRDCGFPTCLAFASMVVSEKHPLKNCPHIPAIVLARCEEELTRQYAEGKWLKRDLADEALKWARNRAASMAIEDLPSRIGGELMRSDTETGLRLPYFTDHLNISGIKISRSDGTELTRLEQVFILNHMAQGGSATPTGRWKGLVDFPNTISKLVSMRSQVEEPLIKHFTGRKEELRKRALQLGAIPLSANDGAADVAVVFTALPRIPVALMFWDATRNEDFQAQVKLMFDETIIEHLDIESIVFLSERIRQLLCDEPAA